MKHFNLFIFICLVASLVLSACSNPIKINRHTSTPLSAAKDFIHALTSGNQVQLNQVVYQSQSMPTNEIMSIAKTRKITGMKSSQFTYQPDPKDKGTIYVSFKDKSGEKDIWKLVFVQNPVNDYQYDGYLSGALLPNTTRKDLAKTYVEALIKNAKNAWLNNINWTREKGEDNGLAVDLSQKYHFYKKSLKDFTFEPFNEMDVIIKFHDNKKLLYMMISTQHDKDGYYLDGSIGGVREE